MKKGLALLTIAGICAYELLAKRRQNLPQQEALLQAIQAEEDKTQDKLKEKKGVLIRGSKNW